MIDVTAGMNTRPRDASADTIVDAKLISVGIALCKRYNVKILNSRLKKPNPHGGEPDIKHMLYRDKNHTVLRAVLRAIATKEYDRTSSISAALPFALYAVNNASINSSDAMPALRASYKSDQMSLMPSVELAAVSSDTNDARVN